jgi:hypothetical protein
MMVQDLGETAPTVSPFRGRSEGRKGHTMTRNHWAGLLCAAALGLAGTAVVTPAAALDLNGIKVTPSIGYKGEYDDNIFRTQFNKRSDYVNHIMPSITLEATPGRHEFKAGYQADILRYSSYNNMDTERHAANVMGVMRFNRLELRASEEFRRTDDFPTSEVTQRIRRNENDLSAGFDLDMARMWGIGFDAGWNHYNYLESAFDGQDHNTYTYAGNLYYRLTAKTRVFGEYAFVDEYFSSDETRRNTRHRGMVGIRGDITERFNLTGKVGYEHLNFHDSSRQDLDTAIGSIEATYKPVDRMQISLMLARKVDSSTFGTNAQYAAYNSILGVTYALTPKITLIPRGFFGVDNYKEAAVNTSKDGLPAEKRVDYLYGGGLGLRYQVMKWLRLDASYDFSRRDSKFNNFDYDDNIVNFSVTFSM